MNKIAVIADSNSSITHEAAKELGINVLPMPFFIDEELYFEDVDLTKDGFYEKLKDGCNVSTSQPSPADIADLWDKLLKDHDEIVHIPMSSGLSASCETAMALARSYDGKVQVVDNQRISLTQKSSALDALELIKSGKNAKEIKTILENEKAEASIYIMVDTLEYLKKGGRITPTAAMIGTVLKLKPVLQLQGEKLDSFAKARSQKLAKKIMTDAIVIDLEERFKEATEKGYMRMGVCHTANEEEAALFAKELEKVFPGAEIEIESLPLSIACHIGPGTLAITATKKVEV
jgi:EDD domain protein, DegV family